MVVRRANEDGKVGHVAFCPRMDKDVVTVPAGMEDHYGKSEGTPQRHRGQMARGDVHRSRDVRVRDDSARRFDRVGFDFVPGNRDGAGRSHLSRVVAVGQRKQ